jgi:ribose/xylose/arabinose/galactoside ABC-type transport system permease subunit
VASTGGRDWRAVLGRWETLLVGLLIVTAIAGQGISPEFLTTDSFTTGSLDLSEIALMALPLAMVIIAAEIDLSVASVLALSSAASSPARCAARSTGCWSRGSGCRRWP